MREYGLTVLVAAAVTYLLTPLIRRFAIGVGARHAARDRDVHVEPTALLGGLAMYGGLAAGLLVASRLTHLGTVFHGTRVASGLLLAGAVLVLVGFVDDRWGIGVLPKLAGQVAAGVILVWSGAVVAWLPLPGRGTLSLTADQQTALTILVVVVTINAVNFIDGLDGLAAGIVGIGAAAFFIYYYTLTKRLGLDEQTGPALASAVLAGVCLGFLPHNFNPARIFMGDTGSMLLGLLLAYAPISSLASLDPSTLTTPSAYGGGTVNRFPEVLQLLVPATIMLIPYADLLLAVFRRTRAGLSPFAADKKHLQHRLLAIGHSHRASVLIMYLWATLFAGTVVLLSIMRTKLLVLAMVTVAGVLVLLLASMPRLRWWTRRGSQRLAQAAASPVPSPVPATPGPRPSRPGGPGPSWYPATAEPRPAPPAEPVPSWYPAPPGGHSGHPAEPARADPPVGVPGTRRGRDGAWPHDTERAGQVPAATKPDGAGAHREWPGPPAEPEWPGQAAEPQWPGQAADPEWPGAPAAHPWPSAPAHQQRARPGDGDDTESPLAPWHPR
jgi:UDP-GlcNAc:undecaprenyl-phosphate GlcNAc-1-phosphate transferase